MTRRIIHKILWVIATVQLIGIVGPWLVSSADAGMVGVGIVLLGGYSIWTYRLWLESWIKKLIEDQ